jgi:N-methyl-L-tryptophan oxidase
VQPVRKVFAWFQADGRYSTKNRFPAFTGEMADGSQYYGFPAEDNALKIGKHNGGQRINEASERVPFGAVASDGSECFPFLRQFLPGIGGCLYGPLALMIIRLMKTSSSIPFPIALMRYWSPG